MTSPAWRAVPAEATEEMREAAIRKAGMYPTMRDRWNAMLAARPRPDYDAMAAELEAIYYREGGDMAFALREYFEGE